MSLLALGLTLGSCFTHALWNILAKRSSKTPAFFLVASLGVLAAGLPFFLYLDGPRAFELPAALAVILGATGICQAGYYVFLALAYRRGDVSVVYPLVRTTPIFVLLIAGLFMGLWPRPWAVAGIGLVVGGCFVLPLRKFARGPDGLAWANYANRASLFALGAALASSGYTVLDKIGTGYTEALYGRGLRAAFVYGYLELGATVVALLPAVLVMDGAGAVAKVWREERRTALAVGGLLYFTYMLILWAYMETTNVAYVAALRQFSILIAVAAGIVYLKEPGGRIRILAAGIIVAGLTMVGLAAVR